jgi:hypothetical protein
MRTSLYAFPYSSRAGIVHNLKLNARYVNVTSSSEFDVISNGALGMAVSLILCTGKCTRIFKETVLAVNLQFQHIGLNLQKNQVRHWKEH